MFVGRFGRSPRFPATLREAGHKRYIETRKKMQESIGGDKAGFSARLDGDDIQIIHNEGMFLLVRRGSEG